MSATVTSNVSWRKRKSETPTDLQIDMKRPRTYYYRLASESSIGSEEDTESVYSVQGRETDIARDSPDTISRSEDDDDDDEELIEYEVESISGSDNDLLDLSTSGSEDHVILAAAVEAMCDSSLDTWITDCEESDDNSSFADISITRLGYITCIQCKSINDNPLFRYCEKCFQDRKKMYPPRPRGNRKQKRKAADSPVKLDTLRSCLSGLSSQDSGVGSSQECPPLDLGQIIVPDIHLKPGTSLSDVKDILEKDSGSKQQERELRRKRQASESSISDYEIKKPKYTRPKSRSPRPSSRNATKGSACQSLRQASTSSQEQAVSSQTDIQSTSSSQISSYDGSSISQTKTDSKLSSSSQSFYDNTSTSLSQVPTDSLLSSSSQQSSLDIISLSEAQTDKLSSLSQSSQDGISLSQTSTNTCVSLSQSSTVSSLDKPISTLDERSATSDYGSECLRTNSPESILNSSEIISKVSNSLGSVQSSELCIMCNIAPKDSIFVHANSGHQCCCYKCAKRTLHAIKRCPICNRLVNKIVKIYKV